MATDSTRLRFVVGCMSGTSLDAVDAALVRIDGEGLAMRAEARGFATRPLDELRDPLRRLAGQAPMTSGEIARAAHAFSLLHIDAIREAARDRPIDLIVVHGQTVFHQPPVSWQLLSPAPIAAAFRAPLVYDLRAADLAAGGQGAPITPVADFVLFRSDSEKRAIVNLGGFVNITRLPAAARGTDALAAIRGGDVCVCNQLLDTIARELLGVPFDADGRLAADGDVVRVLFDELRFALEKQAASGRSLGTGDELTARVRDWGKTHRAENVARTACAAIAHVTLARLTEIDRVLLAGGGAKNATLFRAFRDALRAPVEATDAVGVPCERREAIAMAVLGALCQDRVPIALPQVTHATARAISGAWIPAPA